MLKEERLKKQPIFVTENYIDFDKDWKLEKNKLRNIYQFYSKEATSKAPKAQQELQATIRSYPAIQKEIEKIKPEIVIFSSKAKPSQQEQGWVYYERVFVRPPPSQYEKKSKIIKEIKRNVPKSEQIEALKYEVERTPFPKEELKRTVNRKRRRAIAEHMFHELQHVKQVRKYGADSMLETEEKYGYYDSPFEVEARKSAEQKLRRALPVHMIRRKSMVKYRKKNINTRYRKNLTRDIKLKMDTDRDGVLDYNDCQPFNPKKHYTGPPELPIDFKDPEQLEKTYKKVKKNAFKFYSSKKEAVEIGDQIAHIFLREKVYEPKGASDLRARGLPVSSFETKYFIHPKIPTTILEVSHLGQGGSEGNIKIYVDVGKTVHSYSAINFGNPFSASSFPKDNRDYDLGYPMPSTAKYVKGWQGPRKVFLVATEMDVERMGYDFPEFLRYVYENHLFDILKKIGPIK